mgnify:FL=1
MDAIITLIRLPIGLIGIIAVIIWWVVLFPIETVFACVFLPLGVIFMKRKEFKESWICSWPNSLKKIFPNIDLIWEWIVND